jgi:hypothetical protein
MTKQQKILSILTIGTAALGAVAPAVAGASSSAPPVTCSQLTKAELQPLLAHPFTKITTQPVLANQVSFTLGNKVVGQTCTVADSDTSNAMLITVVGGSAGSLDYTDTVKGTQHAVSVPGIGTKAIRQAADSSGEAPGIVSALKGTTYCSIDPQEGETPGEARLEVAAGNTGRIGDQAYADMAAADGTLCNRIFGSGNTNPAAALAALAKIKPGHAHG